MSVDLIRQIVDHVVGETLIGGRKSGAMVADGETAGSIEQFKTLLAEKLRTAGGSPGSSSGTSYLVKTYAELVALIDAEGLIPGTLYKISDRGDRGLFFTAISTTQLAKDGTRLMLCPARYSRNETDGDGNVWKGVWNANKEPDVDDLMIWGGKVWKNLTASIGTADSQTALDSTNWLLISKTSFSNNEYVEKIFGCSYDVENDWVEKQWDSAGNEFGFDFSSETFEGIGFNMCDVSDWNFSANNDDYHLFGNKVIGVWNNSCRSIVFNRCGWGIFGNSNNGEITNNMNTYQIALNSNGGEILGNTNNGTIDSNSNGAAGANGSILRNSNNGAIQNNSNTGLIQYNKNVGNIANIGAANGDIKNNINNGNISITTTGDISDPIVNK